MNHESSLDIFFRSDERKVAILKGPWGIGKTFYWTARFEGSKETLSQVAYSYISLFGIQNLQELKKAVFRQAIVLKKDGFLAYYQKLKPASDFLRSTNLPWIKEVNDIAGSIEDIGVGNYLVCFDDLERKHNGLSMRDVLGFISFLKEQRNCKIIIILNEFELDQDSVLHLNKYREKLIDFEILYNPSVEENYEVFLKDYPDFLIWFKTLNINNLRVMRQTQWVLESFKPFIAGLIPELTNSFLNHVALLAIFRFGFSGIIDLNTIHKKSPLMRYFRKGKKEDVSLEDQIVFDTQWNPEEFDEYIIEFIKTGIMNGKKLRECLLRMNEKEKVEILKKELSEFYNIVWANFKNTQEHCLKAGKALLERAVGQLDFNSFYELSKFMSGIGLKSAFELLKEHAISRIEIATNHELEVIEKKVQDLEILELISKQKISSLKGTPIHKIVLQLTDSNGWNPSDFRLLDEYDVGEIETYLTSEADLRTIYACAEIIRRSGYQKDEETEDAIASRSVVRKINDCLNNIAKTSRLNELRVESIFNRLKR